MPSSKVTFPPGFPIAKLSLINPVSFGPVFLAGLMGPPIPHVRMLGSEADRVPSLSFFIEHSTGRRLVWDLGIRKDWENYAPVIANYIPGRDYHIQARSVADILEEGGVDRESIEAVIWSHWHWDHIGDPSTFPLKTALIVGPGFKETFLPAWPTNPESPLRESDWAGRTLTELSFSSNPLKIGPFDAIDYFGDGSLYFLSTPGHAIGHLCALVRTTSSTTPNEKDTFVLLGGDICHHGSIFRPSPQLPLPSFITPHPLLPPSLAQTASFCPGHAYEELQRERGMSPTGPILKPEFGLDIPLALRTIEGLQELDCEGDVWVLIAHDKFARDAVEHFPAVLNGWRDQGWGERLRWAFLKDFEEYWKAKGVAGHLID